MSVNSYFYDPIFESSSELADINRLFEATFQNRVGSPSENNTPIENRNQALPGNLRSSPKMDLHESKEKNELTAIIELPGVNKEDVSVEILDGCLIISGERTVSKDLDKAGYAVRERRFGRFSRAIRLSPGVKSGDINAKMENGILTVTFPISVPQAEPKKIAIF